MYKSWDETCSFFCCGCGCWLLCDIFLDECRVICAEVVGVTSNVCLCPGWTLGAVLYENSKIEPDCEHSTDDDDDDDVDIRALLSRLIIVGSDKDIT